MADVRFGVGNPVAGSGIRWTSRVAVAAALSVLALLAPIPWSGAVGGSGSLLSWGERQLPARRRR